MKTIATVSQVKTVIEFATVAPSQILPVKKQIKDTTFLNGL